MSSGQKPEQGPTPPGKVAVRAACTHLNRPDPRRGYAPPIQQQKGIGREEFDFFAPAREWKWTFSVGEDYKTRGLVRRTGRAAACLIRLAAL